MCSLMLDDAWRILRIKHEVNAMAYECRRHITSDTHQGVSIEFKQGCCLAPQLPRAMSVSSLSCVCVV